MGGKKQGQNKTKQEPQQPKQQQQQQQQQVHHHHDHENHAQCNHAHNTDQPDLDVASLLGGLQGKPEGLMSTLGMLPKLQEMFQQLSNIGGGQPFKPDDPIPDFTKFDSAKQILEVAIEDFQKTIDQVEKKEFKNLAKPEKAKPQQQKISKQQQQQRDRNHQIIKQNIDYLNNLQSDLKRYIEEPKLIGIQAILNQGLNNLKQDIQYYQKQLEI